MACEELDINFIGIEKEREYCEISQKRIAAVRGKTLPVINHTETHRAEERFAGDKSNSNPVRATTASPNENPPRNDEHRQRLINEAVAKLKRKT